VQLKKIHAKHVVLHFGPNRPQHFLILSVELVGPTLLRIIENATKKSFGEESITLDIPVEIITFQSIK